MKKIIVASLNPAKINAVKLAFEKMFPEESFVLSGCSVDSGVRDQPMTDEETLLGAINRVENAMEKTPNMDYWVGLEGGIEVVENEMIVFAWMVIKNDTGHMSKSRTGTFVLPNRIKELVLGGMELGHADDLVFKKDNSKQGNGAVGLLSKDLITRDTYYEHALILALIPFLNRELYDET